MSQTYLNGPSAGRAMSAEEFAAGTSQRPGPQPCPPPTPGCGCGPDPMPPMPPMGCGCGCGCGTMPPDCPIQDDCGQGAEHCQRLICCCAPMPPSPEPPQVEEGCCCKQSFRAALGLLCDQRISSLLDFDTAAFITDGYVAGTTLQDRKPHSSTAESEAGNDTASGTQAYPGPGGKPTPPDPNRPSDNLRDLSGSFRRFAPCSCDLLDISAKVYTSSGKDCSFTATQVNLCELDAVVIQGAAAAAEGDLTSAEATARNFRCVRAALAQRLSFHGDPCGQSCCSCACDGRDCCCAAGLLGALAQNNLSRRVSLVAGLLVLQNVTLLGTVGNVLVLSNDTDDRLYFVCVNSVQFIG